MIQRRSINGLWNMGRPRVPPLPAAIIMTDRTTGTLYQLSQLGDPGSLTLNVTTTLQQQPDKSFFGPNDGPYLPRTPDLGVRLWLDNGTLKGELYQPPLISGPRVLTRKAWKRVLLEITVGPDWQPGDPFVFTEIDLGAHLV
jgi:hypothetical protein